MSSPRPAAADGHEIRYFFYLTNDHQTAAADVVFLANDRCHQENLIDQLKHGVGATRMPVDTLVSNWAYMVLAALAWTLKAWFALRLPETGRWATRYAAETTAVLRMQFKMFVNAAFSLSLRSAEGRYPPRFAVNIRNRTARRSWHSAPSRSLRRLLPDGVRVVPRYFLAQN